MCSSSSNENSQYSNRNREPFNPNGCKYRTCCCHVKTVSYTVAIVEAILITVAMLYTVRILCIASHTVGSRNVPNPQNNRMRYHHNHHHRGDKHKMRHWYRVIGGEDVRFQMMALKVLLAKTILEVAVVAMLFHGLCKQKWGFLVPYLVGTGLTIVGSLAAVGVALIFIGSDCAEVYREIGAGKSMTCGILWVLKNVYFFYVIYRCMNFFKDRAEAFRCQNVTSVVIFPMAGMKYAQPQEEGDIDPTVLYDPPKMEPEAPPLYQEAMAHGLYP